LLQSARLERGVSIVNKKSMLFCSLDESEKTGKLEIENNKTYFNFLEDIKKRVLSARISAARTINRNLVELYWDIGRMIVEKQEKEGWGKSVVEKLSQDLQKEYPGEAGFSSRNLWDMKRFYEQYASHKKLRQAVAEIPWGHNLLIMSKISDFNARSYYIEATQRLGWSRNVLLNQIKSEAYKRSLIEKKTHNFEETLPEYLASVAWVKCCIVGWIEPPSESGGYALLYPPYIIM
jgi:predicted nuclease of restriction endonuclease-like (RecB) superfamily